MSKIVQQQNKEEEEWKEYKTTNSDNENYFACINTALLLRLSEPCFRTVPVIQSKYDFAL